MSEPEYSFIAGLAVGLMLCYLTKELIKWKKSKQT